MKTEARAFAAILLSAATTIAIVADEAKQPAPRPVRDAAWFKKADKDGDGRLSRQEAPDQKSFDEADTDRDGFATVEELQVFLTNRSQGKLAAKKPAAKSVASKASKLTPAPETYRKKEVTIFSDGTRMAGDLYLPADLKEGEKRPAIVFCAGTGGTKSGTGGRLGPNFAAHGYIALAFDYRGWGASESQLMAVDTQPKPDETGQLTTKVRALRWQMNYTDQTEDIGAAISFLAGEPGVDPERIGILGSSYGGGLVTWMAGTDPRVKCVVAQVPGLGGVRNASVRKRVDDLRTKQARGETEPVPIETGKLGGKLERYDQMRVNPAKNVGYDVAGAARNISIPALFVVAENEELSDNETVRKVHEEIKARAIPTDYLVIKGITHYGIYREGFEEATLAELAWFDRHLKQKTEAPVAATNSSGQEEAKPTTPDRRDPGGAAPRANPEAAFKFLDADANGFLTETELGKLKESVPFFRSNPDALSQFFGRLDSDQDGKITLEEYRKVTTMRRQGNPQSNPAARPTEKPSSETKITVPEPVDAKPSGAVMNETRQAEFFEKSIRPVLVSQCYSCHSTDSKDIKGGLVLDTREGIRNGGDSGPAVVPKDIAASLLLTAIRHKDGMAMPPKSKLSEEQIADFVTWIENGAFDPRDTTSVRASSGVDIEKGREFWAFRAPVKSETPAVKDEKWPLTDIDRFVKAAQERNGIIAVGDADPRVLVRRLYFDLIGLPPAPEDVEKFEREWRGDAQATLKSTVDRLLDSPRFGERWGRHWLDVARFAESSGKETSFAYPQAWRYRDYVIASLNADVSYDQFVKEQIAGDLLPAADDSRRAAQMIATGFLALGPKSHIERNKRQFEMDLADEQIDAVSQSFLGLTVACARCHDHKFDPIRQSDYYALAGIFRSTETLYGTIPVIQNNNPGSLLNLPESSESPTGVPSLNDEQRQRLEERIAELRTSRREMVRNKSFATSEFVQNGILLNTLESKLTAYHKDGTPKLLAMGVRDRQTPRDSELFVRGEVVKPGAIVPRGFVQVLCGPETPAISSGSGRLELAEWIASPHNPLTARVMVNRVWLNLFGRGLVTTPDNFGKSGQAPSHPELLDYLAVSFVEDEWSVKKLIRRLVLSRVYRLDSKHHDGNHAVDPDNVNLWRMSPRRLDSEAIRDAMLATAGMLDLEPPTGSVVARGGEGYTGGLERGGQLAERNFVKRAVYLPVIRGRAFESLDVFDGVDGSMVTGQRDQTTVPAQSLFLLNSPFVTGLATNAAGRLVQAAADPAARVNQAYLLWFGRNATEAEKQNALGFVNRYRSLAAGAGKAGSNPEFAAWVTFCQSLWASAEFLERN